MTINANHEALVEESTGSTGTGTINLAGAVAQRRQFRDAFPDGARVPYVILDGDGAAWERGMGTLTYGAPDTLSRAHVISSSNAGSLITLSANTHQVFVGSVPELGGGFRGACYSLGLGNQTISNALLTDITWDTEEWNTEPTGLVVPGTDIPIPDYINFIRVTCSINWAANATGARSVTFQGTGGVSIGLTPQFVDQPGFSGDFRQQGSFIANSAHINFTAGRGVKVRVSQNSGGNLDVELSSFVQVEYLG